MGDHVGQIRACWAQGLDLSETLDTALQTVQLTYDEGIGRMRLYVELGSQGAIYKAHYS